MSDEPAASSGPTETSGGTSLERTRAAFLRAVEDRRRFVPVPIRAVGADLERLDLTRAPLQHGELAGVNLSHAVLVCADLRSADLIGANLTGANLRNATLTDAKLLDARFFDANLAGASLPEAFSARLAHSREQLATECSQASAMWRALLLASVAAAIFVFKTATEGTLVSGRSSLRLPLLAFDVDLPYFEGVAVLSLLVTALYGATVWHFASARGIARQLPRTMPDETATRPQDYFSRGALYAAVGGTRADQSLDLAVTAPMFGWPVCLVLIYTNVLSRGPVWTALAFAAVLTLVALAWAFARGHAGSSLPILAMSAIVFIAPLASRTTYPEGDMRGADFSGTNLRGMDMVPPSATPGSGAMIQIPAYRIEAPGAAFVGADAGGVRFSANLDCSTFEGAYLVDVVFGNASRRPAYERPSSLRGARFDGACLAGANFAGVDLRGASFVEADLRDARFDNAILTDVSFERALIEGATFYGARVDDASTIGPDGHTLVANGMLAAGSVLRYPPLPYCTRRPRSGARCEHLPRQSSRAGAVPLPECVEGVVPRRLYMLRIGEPYSYGSGLYDRGAGFPVTRPSCGDVGRLAREITFASFEGSEAGGCIGRQVLPATNLTSGGWQLDVHSRGTAPGVRGLAMRFDAVLENGCAGTWTTEVIATGSPVVGVGLQPGRAPPLVVRRRFELFASSRDGCAQMPEHCMDQWVGELQELNEPTSDGPCGRCGAHATCVRIDSEVGCSCDRGYAPVGDRCERLAPDVAWCVGASCDASATSEVRSATLLGASAQEYEVVFRVSGHLAWPQTEYSGCRRSGIFCTGGQWAAGYTGPELRISAPLQVLAIVPAGPDVDVQLRARARGNATVSLSEGSGGGSHGSTLRVEVLRIRPVADVAVGGPAD